MRDPEQLVKPRATTSVAIVDLVRLSPDEDGGEVGSGLVHDGELVRSHGKAGLMYRSTVSCCLYASGSKLGGRLRFDFAAGDVFGGAVNAPVDEGHRGTLPDVGACSRTHRRPERVQVVARLSAMAAQNREPFLPYAVRVNEPVGRFGAGGESSTVSE